MRSLIKVLIVSVALLVVTGCEKTIKEGVNMNDRPSELASAK
jgi:hypothetical protein